MLVLINKKMNEKFDVIYIDPPYFSGIYEMSLDVVKNIELKFYIIKGNNKLKEILSLLYIPLKGIGFL